MKIDFFKVLWYNIATNGGSNMKREKNLSDFSLPVLNAIKQDLENYHTIEEFQSDLDQMIREKEEENRKNPNVKFDRAMFVRLHIFDPWELRVLDLYQIHNLQELIDLDMNSLVDVPYSIREKLEWARRVYDLRGMQEKGVTINGNK